MAKVKLTHIQDNIGSAIVENMDVFYTGNTIVVNKQENTKIVKIYRRIFITVDL